MDHDLAKELATLGEKHRNACRKAVQSHRARNSRRERRKRKLRWTWVWWVSAAAAVVAGLSPWAHVL